MHNPPYWTLTTLKRPSPALQALQWLYTNYCRQMWETVNQAIAQAMSGLPTELKECLHKTLTYEERQALKSDVLWLLIEQTGATVDLVLDSTDALDRRRIAIALEVRDEKISGFREYFGDVDW
jgi:hypothetical protein